MALAQQRGCAGDVRRRHARPAELLPTVPSRRGTDESTSTPGAVTSGFIRSESGVGPPEEKDAIVRSDSDSAATVIARCGRARRGHRPVAEVVVVVPGRDDRDDPGRGGPVEGAATMSRLGSISASPSERLITSIRSRTAASIAATISGELPFSPKPVVGIVSTL